MILRNPELLLALQKLFIGNKYVFDQAILGTKHVLGDQRKAKATNPSYTRRSKKGIECLKKH